MSVSGTAAYHGYAGAPPLVAAAVTAAGRAGFANSCRPEQGELLRLLAGGVGAGVIGETGTGYGVGLAWLLTSAHPAARLVSIERNPDRATAAAGLFAHDPRVRVRTGDWRELAEDAPFDLLVLDGSGHGKNDQPPLEPAGWLRVGGVVVLDDFTPMTTWPPLHQGRPDTTRMHWLNHPRLRAAELKVTMDSATIVATYLG